MVCLSYFISAFGTLICCLSRDNVRHLTDHVPNARYKGFTTHRDAEQYYTNAKKSRKIQIIRNPGDGELYGPLDHAIQ
jgi:hypothetical protein